MRRTIRMIHRITTGFLFVTWIVLAILTIRSYAEMVRTTGELRTWENISARQSMSLGDAKDRLKELEQSHAEATQLLQAEINELQNRVNKLEE